MIAFIMKIFVASNLNDFHNIRQYIKKICIQAAIYQNDLKFID